MRVKVNGCKDFLGGVGQQGSDLVFSFRTSKELRLSFSGALIAGEPTNIKSQHCPLYTCTAANIHTYIQHVVLYVRLPGDQWRLREASLHMNAQ